MRSVGPFIRLIIFLLLSYAVPASGDDRQARDGFLAVTVTRGEERSPESRADVFVHGYRPVYLGELSALLSQRKEGVCEASPAPGIYDVFIRPHARRCLVACIGRAPENSDDELGYLPVWAG